MILRINNSLILLFFAAIHAQTNMEAVLTNGLNKNFPLSEFKKITFSDSLLIIEDNIDLLNLKDIQKIIFNDNMITSAHQKLPLNIVTKIYPNPVSKQANILFTLTSTSTVNISIHNTIGIRTITIHEGILQKGEHEISFDMSNASPQLISSGVYFVNIELGDQTIIKKIIVNH